MNEEIDKKLVNDIKEEVNGEMLDEMEENYEEVITEENKDEILKKRNLKAAENLLTTSMVVGFISVLTYAIPFMAEGWVDYGFAFEIVGLLFAFMAKSNAKYKEENKAIINTTISLFSLSFLAVYDLIYAWQHRNELVTTYADSFGNYGVQLNYGIDIFVLANIILLISTLVVLHRKELKIKENKTNDIT